MVGHTGDWWYKVTPNAVTNCTKATGTSESITGLSENTVYGANAWTNNACTGDKFTYRVFTTLTTTAPLAPTKPLVSPGDQSVTLAWTSRGDGGSAITKWEYVKKEGSGAFEATWNEVPNSTATTSSYTVTGLTNDTAYKFKVRAVNGNGNGDASAASDAVTPRKPTLTSSDVTTTGATLTIGNYSEAWYYKQTEPTSQGTYTSCSPEVSAGTTTATLTGLSASTTYTFQAYKNLDCSVVLGDPVTFRTSTRQRVAPSISISTSAIMETTAALAIANYEGSWWYKRTEPTGDDHPYGSCSAEVSGTSVNLTGLSAGTTYTFTAYSDSGCNTEIASHSLTTATSTAASLPAPSVTPTALTLAEAGGTGTYTIVLGSEPTGDVTVTVSSSDSTAATVAPTSLTFTPSNYSDRQTVTVSGVDDDVVNNPLRTATVSHNISGGGYDNVAVGSVTVTLKDDDDAASKEKEATQAAERVDNATLAEVVKQAAGATSTAITNRLSSIASVAVGGVQPLNPTSPTDPASPAGNGGSGDDAASLLESLTTDAAQFLWSRQGAIQRGDLQLQQALAGRRFAIPLSALSQSSASGAQGGFATSTLSLWGSADYTSYENILDGVDLDGDVFLVAVGLDTQPRADLVTGLAVAINSSDFDYTYNAVDNQSVGTEEAEGTYEVSITTVNPYVSWSASEHLDVWATCGLRPWRTATQTQRRDHNQQAE